MYYSLTMQEARAAATLRRPSTKGRSTARTRPSTPCPRCRAATPALDGPMSPALDIGILYEIDLK